MLQKKKLIHLSLSLLCLCLLTACGGRSATPTFFVLDSGEATPVMALDNTNGKKKNSMPKMQLRQIDIPQYLDRDALVSREADGVRLLLAEFDSWGESLSSGTRRVMAEVLTPLLIDQGVLLQPLDDDSLGPWQIFVQIQRFDGPLNGDVVLDARWTVRSRYDTVLVSGAFVDKAPAGLTYTTMVQAQSALLKKMATAMAQPMADAVKKK